MLAKLERDRIIGQVIKLPLELCWDRSLCCLCTLYEVKFRAKLSAIFPVRITTVCLLFLLSYVGNDRVASADMLLLLLSLHFLGSLVSLIINVGSAL